MSTEPPGPVDPSRALVVRSHLEEIFASPAFRGSERCRQFLQFVVDHSLSSPGDQLKERDLGIRLFSRPPDYDTGADAIVRVKANEVRKRLDQYYRERPEPPSLTIELPPGAYLPRFTMAAPLADATPAPGETLPPFPQLVLLLGRRYGPRILPVLLIFILAAVGLHLFTKNQNRTALDEFWEPVVDSSSNAVLCLGRSDTYTVAKSLELQLHDIPPTLAAEPITIRPSDIRHFTNFHISYSNFTAVHEISRLLLMRGKDSEIRWASELKVNDVHGKTLILIGAFSNPWTIRKTSEWRYEFRPGAAQQSNNAIFDRETGRSWMARGDAADRQTLDYGMVSRVFGPGNGEIKITAAGISSFGTLVSGNFISDPAYWKELAPRLPAGWQKKNLQIILETSIVNMTPNPPRVVAIHVW